MGGDVTLVVAVHQPHLQMTVMISTIITGSKILAMGDFQYFVIVDRLGVDIEIVPNMFGPGLRPTGQRGIYAIWRNTSKILDPAAFRVLVAG